MPSTPSGAVVYAMIGNPSPDLYADIRPGDNRWTESLVALNAETGELIWGYQYVPHDPWDLDAVSPPILAEVQGANGGMVPGVIHGGKVYVHDAESGKLLRRSENMIPHENLFTQPTEEGIRMLPGANGGVEWSPGAFNPDTRMVYYVNLHQPMTYTVEKEEWEPPSGDPRKPAHSAEQGRLWLGGRASLLGVSAVLMPKLTGRDNIWIGAQALGLSPAEVRAKFDDIVEFADIGRFPSRDHFAAYNGTAPIEVSSGERRRKVFRLSRRGNRRLNHAIHMAAVTQIRHRHSPGRAYYDRKIAEGHSGKEAIRALKRRISDAVYRQLRIDADRAGAHAAGPGGHTRNDSVASAAGSHPEHRLFGQASPGPATTLRPTGNRSHPSRSKAPSLHVREVS